MSNLIEIKQAEANQAMMKCEPRCLCRSYQFRTVGNFLIDNHGKLIAYHDTTHNTIITTAPELDRSSVRMVRVWRRTTGAAAIIWKLSKTKHCRDIEAIEYNALVTAAQWIKEQFSMEDIQQKTERMNHEEIYFLEKKGA